MDNKNFPENGHDNLNAENASARDDSLFDDDIYIPDSQEAEPSDDDLDISELLRKYLPDFTSDESGAEKNSVDVSSILTENVESSDDAGAGDLEEYSEELIPEEDSSADYEETSSEDEASGDEIYYASAEADDSEDGVLTADAYDGMEDTSPSEDFSEYGSGEIQDDDYDWEDSVSDDYASVTEEGEPEDYSEYSYVSDDAPYEDGGEDSEPVSGESEIPEDANLDATDINLMVAFGLDDELAKTMGPEVAAKIAEEIDAEAKEREDRVRRSVENEYLDASQTPAVAARLKTSFRHLKAKILFAVLLTLLLLFYENLKMFGIQFNGALNPSVYPVVYIMISLQIMLICAAVGYEQLLGGAADLFKGKINPKSVAFIGNAVAVVYSAFQAESVTIPKEPALFNACAASMTLFALIYDYFAVKRNILSFNIICSKRPKYAVRYMSAEDAGIPGGLFEADDVSGGGVLRIEKTKFIDGFFARSEAGTKSGRGYCTAYVFISAVIAALMGVYVGFGGDRGGIGALNAAFVTFFATMPLSLFISMGYPFYKGASNAYDLDGTVIGEASAKEYSEAGAVCFDDVDAFPSYGVKVQNIKIYNNHRIDRVLYYAASAFKAAGGPLSDVFEVATMEIGISDRVEIQSAVEGYLAASVDDKSIIFGRADALRENGINLPDAVTEEDDTLSAELCPMYMIREGRLMAKLLVRYMMDSDFEFLLKELADEGMCACIKTFDPNIDDELVTMRLGGGRYPFRVLRYNDVYEINRISERLSSGIVSRGTTKPLLSIIGSCSKMLGMRRAGFTVGVVSSVISAIVVWLLVSSGGFSSISSLAVIVYQALWALPVAFTTKLFLR